MCVSLLIFTSLVVYFADNCFDLINKTSYDMFRARVIAPVTQLLGNSPALCNLVVHKHHARA